MYCTHSSTFSEQRVILCFTQALPENAYKTSERFQREKHQFVIVTQSKVLDFV